MVTIPFPLTTSPGERPSEGSGRLINARASPVGQGGRATAVIHRVPGLKPFGTTDLTTFRGAVLDGSTLYAAFEDQIVSFTSAGGAATIVDGLDGSDRVYWAKNNKRPTPDIMLVCAAGVFKLASGSVTDLGDSDLPSGIDVCFLNGFLFVAIADGRVFASGLNAITFGANDYAAAESKSDRLYRVIPWSGNLLLCGANSIEVWSDPINATGFPLSRVTVIQRGIVGQKAITGYEDGFGAGLVFVADDNTVRQLVGYQANKVSPPDLDRLIESVSDKSTLEMCCYISGGHPVVVLSCPDWCWEYDLDLQKWNERKSYLSSTWRGTQSFYAFGKWLCGDTNSGDILEITRNVHTEAADPLIAEVWSAPVQGFPNRARIGRIDLDFATGVGIADGIDPNETDPSVEVSTSLDGGYSFSNPKIRKLGRQGKPLRRVTLFNNGTSGAQGVIVRVCMSDPTHLGLMAGDMNVEIKDK